jgi:pyruvate/2-oxoglutarate dehydrogenase complex dihydrolipoamide dehydrogenase (E3) component
VNLYFKGGHYRLVVVGGGTGGCAVAHKFSRILKKPQQVAVVEPQTVGFSIFGFGQNKQLIKKSINI